MIKTNDFLLSVFLVFDMRVFHTLTCKLLRSVINRLLVMWPWGMRHKKTTAVSFLSTLYSSLFSLLVPLSKMSHLKRLSIDWVVNILWLCSCLDHTSVSNVQGFFVETSVLCALVQFLDFMKKWHTHFDKKWLWLF